MRVIPSGVEIPDEVGEPDEPPHVLFVGRLSEEKGILEFLEATEGLPRVIVGDGPLRDRVPEAVGFVPPAELGRVLRAGRGRLRPVAARGLRHGRARGDGATAGRSSRRAVGGLADVVEDGVNGLLVPPGDVAALRAAIAGLLADSGRARAVGARARSHVEEVSDRRSASRALAPILRHPAAGS